MFPIRDTNPSHHRPVMTMALIAANVLVFLFQLGLSEPATQGLFLRFGVVPARFTDPLWASQMGLAPSLFPFLTTQFLHGGLFHLVGNMWMLWIFGDNVEDRMGPGRFLGFYLLAGLIAGALHFVTNLSSTIPAVGASGAIAGVLGAYLLLYPRARVLTLIPIFFYPWFVELPAAIFLGIWFLLQLASGTQALFGATAGGIAWWAHIGGFVAGLVLLRWFAVRSAPPRVVYPWGPDGPAVIEDPERREPPRW